MVYETVKTTEMTSVYIPTDVSLLYSILTLTIQNETTQIAKDISQKVTSTAFSDKASTFIEQLSELSLFSDQFCARAMVSERDRLPHMASPSIISLHEKVRVTKTLTAILVLS